MLLSFAQFEREIIGERTRDKIAAARRKGRFAGGRPVLGYDLLRDAGGTKLVVNDEEAGRVRGIFGLYLEHEALLPVVTELRRRGWATKAWTTKEGKTVGGKPFDKTLLHHLLTNVIYTGKIRHHAEVHPGVHEGIVDDTVFQRVQAVLQRNRRTGGAAVRNRYGALLKGLLRCASCDCSMLHTYSARQNKRYRYYVCAKAHKGGWRTCETRSVPAGEIEAFVVEQIRAAGRDPAVLAGTVRQMRVQGEKGLAELRAEERSLQRELRRITAESPGGQHAAVQDRVREAEQRLTVIGEQIAALEHDAVDEGEAAAALSAFTPAWDALGPREQARAIRLLVERVDYDGARETVAVTFRPSGLKTFAEQQQLEEVAV